MPREPSAPGTKIFGTCPFLYYIYTLLMAVYMLSLNSIGVS